MVAAPNLPTTHTDGTEIITAALINDIAAAANLVVGPAGGALAGNYPNPTLVAHTHTMPVILGSYSWINPTGADVQKVGFGIGTNTITGVRCIRTGGSAATVNVRVNAATLALTSDLAVGTSYTAQTTIANPTVTDTQLIEIMLQSITGAPTSIVVVVVGTRSTT